MNHCAHRAYILCGRMLPVVLLICGISHAARFALLVGNSTGGADLAALKYVNNDLKSMRSILESFCGFDKSGIMILSDKGAGDLDNALEQMREKLPRGEESLLLFYYTGHADREFLKMGNERYALAKLKKEFTGFPAAIRIGIFDACQSGTFTRLKGGTLSEPFMFKDDGRIKGQVILSSSSPTENSQESDEYGNSIFTFHFVNALRGSADVTGDRKVTLAEAYQYSYNQTVSSTARTWGGTQHPGYLFQIQGEGDIVLADLNIRTVGIVFENDIKGGLTILDEKNNIVADVTKDKGSRMMIALNPGGYTILNKEGQAGWKANTIVGKNGVITMGKKDMTPVEPRKARRKGSERRVRLAITLLPGYRSVNMIPTANDLSAIFNAFSLLGIDPSFTTSIKSISPGGALRLIQKNGMIFLAGLSVTQSYVYSHSYNGSRLNETDSIEYGASLSVTENYRFILNDWGLGYQFEQGYLKGVSVGAGLGLCGVHAIISTAMTDSLFDLTLTKDFEERGLLASGFAYASYSYPVFRFMDMGLQVKYRYQERPEHLSGQASNESPRYDCSGFDFSAVLSFPIAFGRGDYADGD